MFQVKFLILSLLAFSLKEIDGKVFNCAAVNSLPDVCSIDREVLGISDTATFTVSSGLKPANIEYIYFDYFNKAKSVSFRRHFSIFFQMHII
jgi:hypothetical protein